LLWYLNIRVNKFPHEEGKGALSLHPYAPHLILLAGNVVHAALTGSSFESIRKIRNRA